MSYNEDSGKKRSKFNLFFGKMKATVSKLTTTDSEFDVRSGTALAGIRGTTYGIFFDGVQAQVLVFDGSVSLESITRAFEPQVIKKGQLTTVLSDGLAEPVSRIPRDVWEAWDEEFMPFSEEAEEITEEEPEEPEEEPEKRERKGERNINLGATFGSLTINDNFYNRWAIMPEFNRGKFGIGLYLPAIFLPDNGLFAFNEWYNKNEWDFTDLKDILVKIYYLRYGEEGDPLYFRLGGLERVTLYHGFIVDDYTNMLYFPQEINIGAVLDANFSIAGFETFVANVDKGIQTSAARAYLRPMGERFPLSIGGTIFHDRPKPEVWPSGTTNEEQLPHIFIMGLDTGFPIAQLDSFNMDIYVAAAKVGYQYNELHPSLTSVNAGKIEFVKGFGTAIGLAGTVMSRVDYRAEYRYTRDYYEPGIVDWNWINVRQTYQADLLNLILDQNDPVYSSSDSSGIYLSAGVRFFKERLSLGMGYSNYKVYTGTTETVNEGEIYLRLEEGLIPKTWAEINYERNSNFESILKEPFDNDTYLNAEIFYQVAPLLTLSLSYKKIKGMDTFGLNTMLSF